MVPNQNPTLPSSPTTQSIKCRLTTTATSPTSGNTSSSGGGGGGGSMPDQMLKVSLHRGKKKEDFGIILGCRLYVKEITNRATAEKENIREGDILIKINTTNADNLSLKEAKKLMESSRSA